MIVTKSYVYFLGEKGVVYSIYRNPTSRVVKISRKEAKRIIEAEGLTLALENEYGKVWDTPDRKFYNKYKGFFKRKNHAETDCQKSHND